MDRFTIEDAERALERLCKMTGRTYAHRRNSYRDVPAGAWFLERLSPNHVVRVTAYTSPGSTAETNPMGYSAYTYREFVQAVNFMTNALSNCAVIAPSPATGEHRGFPYGVYEVRLTATEAAQTRVWPTGSFDWLTVAPIVEPTPAPVVS